MAQFPRQPGQLGDIIENLIRGQKDLLIEGGLLPPRGSRPGLRNRISSLGRRRRKVLDSRRRNAGPVAASASIPSASGPPTGPRPVSTTSTLPANPRGALFDRPGSLTRETARLNIRLDHFARLAAQDQGRASSLSSDLFNQAVGDARRDFKRRFGRDPKRTPAAAS